jgi:hypothetical protein
VINGKSGETGNIDEENQSKKHNIICVGHQYTQTNTNNINIYTGRKIPSRLIVLHLRYQCRRSDYWVKDTLGINSPPPEVSIPTH